MADEEFVVEWVNPLGRVEYQPTTSEEAMCWDGRYKTWRDGRERTYSKPRLYRFRWMARRKGKKRWKEKVSSQWTMLSKIERNADGSRKA